MLGNAIARRWAPQNGHERREFSRLFGPRTARPPPPRFGPKTPKIARSARARSHENFGDKTLANFFFSAPTFFTRICRANFFFSSFFFRVDTDSDSKSKKFSRRLRRRESYVYSQEIFWCFRSRCALARPGQATVILDACSAGCVRWILPRHIHTCEVARRCRSGTRSRRASWRTSRASCVIKRP